MSCGWKDEPVRKPSELVPGGGSSARRRWHRADRHRWTGAGSLPGAQGLWSELLRESLNGRRFCGQSRRIIACRDPNPGFRVPIGMDVVDQASHQKVRVPQRFLRWWSEGGGGAARRTRGNVVLCAPVTPGPFAVPGPDSGSRFKKSSSDKPARRESAGLSISSLYPIQAAACSGIF